MDWIDWAAVTAVASVVGGVYLLAGAGWALIAFGAILAGVVAAAIIAGEG